MICFLKFHNVRFRKLVKDIRGKGGGIRLYYPDDFYCDDDSDAVQEDQSPRSDGAGIGQFSDDDHRCYFSLGNRGIQ